MHWFDAAYSWGTEVIGFPWGKRTERAAAVAGRSANGIAAPTATLRANENFFRGRFYEAPEG